MWSPDFRVATAQRGSDSVGVRQDVELRALEADEDCTQACSYRFAFSLWTSLDTVRWGHNRSAPLTGC